MQKGGADAAGAKRIPGQRLTGTFRRPAVDDEGDVTEKVSVDRAALKPMRTIGVTVGHGELYGALAPNTGRGGGLEKKAASMRPGDYAHVPGYAGHKPDTWVPHYGRTTFGVHPEGSDSKGESHITTWARPPMSSGAGFGNNVRLREGPPKTNAKGLFKADIEDEIEEVGRNQLKMVGDTCYTSLRKDKRDMTRSGSSRTVVEGDPKPLDRTLNRDPDGYPSGAAGYNDLALFQGFYPPSRHVPGFSGHVPGGSRV
eukprot:TRINITY_DN4663_c2_g1_i1.p1 TRINITY_DN4663_c2_g1~~TRINITY_DN4663_c2_g1_i1.p1  ORF type:complete len:256 (+),score=71.97 TRINITY_DN4663_c2_g1_i1:64-831(+)